MVIQSVRGRARLATAASLVLVAAAALSACGAGSKTGAQSATKVTCDFAKPSKPLTVNVLAYNSSAIDPFTNTMVSSCSRQGVQVKHEPIDFGGQVQKTTATLGSAHGSYDILETYGFVIPGFASQGKLVALDPYFDKYKSKYGLDALNKNMLQAMSYGGKLYGLPMQAQMFILDYRKDVFDKLGLQPPKTFAELRAVARKIQDAGKIKYPLALPMLANADIVTAYDSALGSLGVNLTDSKTMKGNFDTPQATKAFEELKSLKPYMDPQVTTFDQPAVQQQMYNGSAAMSIMFSGRMSDLVNKQNSKYYNKIAFAAPPSVESGGKLYNSLSADGWSIPKNASADPNMLFQMIASSVSEKASKAAIPAAYPAREGMVTTKNSPYAKAANASIASVPPAEPYPWTADISNQITPIVASVFLGKITAAQGTQQMQAIATKVLSKYK